MRLCEASIIRSQGPGSEASVSSYLVRLRRSNTTHLQPCTLRLCIEAAVEPSRNFPVTGYALDRDPSAWPPATLQPTPDWCHHQQLFRLRLSRGKRLQHHCLAYSHHRSRGGSVRQATVRSPFLSRRAGAGLDHLLRPFLPVQTVDSVLKTPKSWDPRFLSLFCSLWKFNTSANTPIIEIRPQASSNPFSGLASVVGNITRQRRRIAKQSSLGSIRFPHEYI